MTTTNTDALTERIARILNDEGWTFEGEHEPGDYDGCEDCRRAVDPIAARVAREVAEEVRAAQIEAWDRGEAEGYYNTGPRWRNSNPYRATETGDQE